MMEEEIWIPIGTRDPEGASKPKRCFAFWLGFKLVEGGTLALHSWVCKWARARVSEMWVIKQKQKKKDDPYSCLPHV